MTTIQDRIEKFCTMCNRYLPLDKFGSNRSTKDGLNYYCAECVHEYNQKYRDKNRERLNKLAGEWRDKNRDKIYNWLKDYRAKNKNLTNKLAKKYRDKYPKEVRAREFIHRMVRYGVLCRKPCEICRNIETDAHHYLGYERINWLDVKWLCQKHHREEHNRLLSITNKEKQNV